MKTDTQLKTDVTSELAWDPSIDATAISVAVKDGVVTLAGHLDSYAEKLAVERAVRRVAGVRGVALDLDVKLSADHKRSDSELAEAALAALRWHTSVPDEQIKVEVEHGWGTLTSEVEWHYQRVSAEQCIRPLMGVRGLANNISIKSRVTETDVSAEILAALTRQARREAQRIRVDVDGGVVTLSGEVHSLPEHDSAIGAASTTRGVTVDKLAIEA